MKHAIRLLLVMFAVWLFLSGHYVPLLITFGVVSSVFVVIVSMRMDVADHEGLPVHLSWRGIIYWPWLVWQIILANIDVARRILSPGLPISPCVVTLHTSQKTELGKVIYANSITLTPGTVTMELEQDQVVVHALNQAAADDLAEGAMDRKVTKMEGHT